MKRSGGWLEPALLAICAAMVAAQLFLPPFIGLADNGDFAKVAGRLSLGARDGPANFVYFVADYVHSPRYAWNSEIFSTELPLAFAASRLARATHDGDAFDIRWLGAIHVFLFLGALVVLMRILRPLPPWRGVWIAAAAIGIFSDVQYVAYFNSFYTDAAALLGLLLMAALAVQIAIAGVRGANAALFFLAAVLFIGSKPQHAIWGWAPAAFLVFAGRKRGLIPALLLLAASVTTVRLMPFYYSAQPLFTLIFHKLAPESPSPGETLAELGLGAGDAAFVGMHAYVPGAPVVDPKWAAGFLRRTSYGAVLRWYMRHPDRTLGLLDETLRLQAPQMRPENLSNFRRQDGHPPGARTGHFALWSGARAALARRWPYHLPVWYLLFIAGSIYAVRAGVSLGWIALGIAALGIGEFSIAALADAAETYRHLFLFHACTDLTVCFALAYAVFFPATSRSVSTRL